MHEPASLRLWRFGSNDPLLQAPIPTRQINYLRRYLGELGATSVIEEPLYFDRDYLAEFSAFYAASASGYPNVCRRLHFFSGSTVDRARLRRLLGGSERLRRQLQQQYLGFTVIRPIPKAPIGRTVLSWYPDQTPTTPRIISPARDYITHIAGIPFKVTGLAWQQQDTGVGACATIALWSMLHSSAFDVRYAIPTTASVTSLAHKTAPYGARVFPSKGLNIFQILEAIKALGLAPLLLEGDCPVPNTGLVGFSRERFSVICSSLVRSKYPVLIAGQLLGSSQSQDSDHAMCVVGFRETAPPPVPPNQHAFQDAAVQYLYLHDDNIGPNVRFRIASSSATPPVIIEPSEPSSGTSGSLHPTSNYPSFRPQQMVVAVQPDVRTEPDTLRGVAAELALGIVTSLNALSQQHGAPPVGVTTSMKVIRLAEYLGPELGRTLGEGTPVLSRVRLELVEKVAPMSLYLGLIRIGLGPQPLVDVLLDTTDTDLNIKPFAYVTYADGARNAVSALCQAQGYSLGHGVHAA